MAGRPQGVSAWGMRRGFVAASASPAPVTVPRRDILSVNAILAVRRGARVTRRAARLCGEDGAVSPADHPDLCTRGREKCVLHFTV